MFRPNTIQSLSVADAAVGAAVTELSEAASVTPLMCLSAVKPPLVEGFGNQPRSKAASWARFLTSRS